MNVPAVAANGCLFAVLRGPCELSHVEFWCGGGQSGLGWSGQGAEACKSRGVGEGMLFAVWLWPGCVVKIYVCRWVGGKGCCGGLARLLWAGVRVAAVAASERHPRCCQWWGLKAFQAGAFICWL